MKKFLDYLAYSIGVIILLLILIVIGVEIKHTIDTHSRLELLIFVSVELSIIIGLWALLRIVSND